MGNGKNDLGKITLQSVKQDISELIEAMSMLNEKSKKIEDVEARLGALEEKADKIEKALELLTKLVTKKR